MLIDLRRWYELMCRWVEDKRRQLKLVALSLVITLFSLSALRSLHHHWQYRMIPFNLFLEELDRGSIAGVHIYSKVLDVDLISGEKYRAVVPTDFVRMNKLLDALIAAKVRITQSLLEHRLQSAFKLIFAFCSLLYLKYVYDMLQSVRGEDASKFADSVDQEKLHTTFRDVAGVGHAKEELKHIVSLVRQARSADPSVPFPRGVLLFGPSGTGKTLLAKAVAGECEIGFLSCSGSDFVDTYAGRGAARVRDLFARARGRAPCVVFIDEIDSLAQRRDTGMGFVNEEREQTVNQLLFEMDSIKSSLRENEAGAVIVIAATNRPKVLDSAVLRSGRFDYHIEVGLPSKEERVEILRIHCRGLPLEDDVNLETLAVITNAFSGADLRLLVDEARRLTHRRGSTSISMEDFRTALRKLTEQIRMKR